MRNLLKIVNDMTNIGDKCKNGRWHFIIFGVIVAVAIGWQLGWQTKNDDARLEHLKQENSRLQNSVDNLNRKNDALQATVNAALLIVNVPLTNVRL